MCEVANRSKRTYKDLKRDGHGGHHDEPRSSKRTYKDLKLPINEVGFTTAIRSKRTYKDLKLKWQLIQASPMSVRSVPTRI